MSPGSTHSEYDSLMYQSDIAEDWVNGVGARDGDGADAEVVYVHSDVPVPSSADVLAGRC